MAALLQSNLQMPITQLAGLPRRLKRYVSRACKTTTFGQTATKRPLINSVKQDVLLLLDGEKVDTEVLRRHREPNEVKPRQILALQGQLAQLARDTTQSCGLALTA